MKHPSNRLERKRLAEAKALQLFKPKKINAKKKHREELTLQEAQDEIARAYRDDLPRSDQTVN
jgi:hypothetical protein